MEVQFQSSCTLERKAEARGDGRPRIVLSANATPGAGGQGLNLQHMMQCFEESYEEYVFASGTGSNWEGKQQERLAVMPPSKLGTFVTKTPILRRRRDWIVYLSETNHDRRVARLIERLDALDYFQGASGQCLQSLRAAKKKRCRTILDVLTLHNAVYSEAAAREAAKFGGRTVLSSQIDPLIECEYAEADIIRVMSEPARATFLERGFDPRRVFVASPPVEIPDIAPDRKEPDPFVVSYVAFLEPAKGFHHLVEAFLGLPDNDAQLWLWGNTGSREMANYLGAKMAACPRIQLKPYSVRQLGHEKVYGASSVLVHPSLADGFGYVVSEAMASGIPVITTTATGASQWIEDGVNGYVVKPGDVEGIRARLVELKNAPAKRREMGQAARQTMRALTVRRMRDCYGNALENNFGVGFGEKRPGGEC